MVDREVCEGQDTGRMTGQESPLTRKKLPQTVWGPDHAEETEVLAF